MNEESNTFMPENARWDCENIIIADADYVDRVAFNLIVNFERMLMRRIPQADLARWIDCIALDGGMRPITDSASQPSSIAPQPSVPTTQVVLIHGKEQKCLENFSPANYGQELNGKAFKDHLGEFVFSALPVEAQTTRDDLFLDVLSTTCQQPVVKRIMLIPNAEDGNLYSDIRELLRRVDDDGKRITVFTMQPMAGGNFRQEILGYSLMNALGIHAEDLSSRVGH